MTKTKQTIKTEITDPDNAPGVIAYRVGMLEKAVTQGFKDHNDKLDSLTAGFATKEELQQIQQKMNDWRWYFRALVAAVMTALATAIGAVLVSNK